MNVQEIGEKIKEHEGLILDAVWGHDDGTWYTDEDDITCDF